MFTWLIHKTMESTFFGIRTGISQGIILLTWDLNHLKTPASTSGVLSLAVDPEYLRTGRIHKEVP